MKADEAHYHLSGLTLEDLEITAADTGFDPSAAENLVTRNVRLTKKDEIECLGWLALANYVMIIVCLC